MAMVNDRTINIVEALRVEIAHLERILAMNIKVGYSPPGEPLFERIKALISDLKLEIEEAYG